MRWNEIFHSCLNDGELWIRISMRNAKALESLTTCFKSVTGHGAGNYPIARITIATRIKFMIIPSSISHSNYLEHLIARHDVNSHVMCIDMKSCSCVCSCAPFCMHYDSCLSSFSLLSLLYQSTYASNLLLFRFTQISSNETWTRRQKWIRHELVHAKLWVVDKRCLLLFTCLRVDEHWTEVAEVEWNIKAF